MNVTEIDSELGRLRRAADTVSANLLELERDPNLELVEAASLEGVSAARWKDAMHEHRQVWEWHKLLVAFLDEAGKRRGTRPNLSADQARALTIFLTGPTIELSRDEIPLAERPLLGPSTMTTRCTADELLGHMSEGYESARNVLFDIGGAWDTLVTRVRDARAALNDARVTVDGAADAQASATVDALQSRLDLLAETLVLDPLAVEPEDLADIETRIGALGSELAGAAMLREELDARLAHARTLLGEVARAIEAAHEAHLEVTTKIAHASVPDPHALGESPGAGLEQVEVLAAEGRWQEAESALQAWNAAAEDQLRAAQECTAANQAPLAARHQLRSLLDAYLARARRLGLAEDDRLSALHAEARDLLYSAPLDLDEAAAVVRTYRDALPDEQSDRKATR